MNAHEHAAPVREKFLTPGVMVLLVLITVGTAFMAARFFFGIGKVTNLNNQFPWGLWVAIDVASGVALAAGGFTTGLIAYVFNRKQYHAIIRPALLTAMLGYTFVVIGLMVDLGRYWNITSPMFNHNKNSVLFEVAICVMIYLHVLYIEFLPIVVERFKGKVNFPKALAGLNKPAEALLSFAEKILDRVMFIFIIAGIVLSCLHQSSLGSLMLIATYKIHPLWYTPILPLLFLLSAFAAGYPMVTFESIIVSKSFGREPEMEILTPLAKYMPVMMGTYLVVKLGDMFYRGTYVYLMDGTYQTNSFIVELSVGVILPFLLLLIPKVRRSPGWLFFASTLFIFGILLNRINVFLVSYTPPYMIKSYFPAVGEIFVTIGLISMLMLLYRIIVHIFPVLGAHPEKMVIKTIVFAIIIPFSAVFFCSSAHAVQEKRPAPFVEKTVPSIADAPEVFMLNSPVVNKYSDQYVPVRFMHRKHAHVLKDCTICHHRVSPESGFSPENGIAVKTGDTIKTGKTHDQKNMIKADMSAGKPMDKYGKKVTMAELTGMGILPSKCSSCHGKPFTPGQLDVPGLKGAYHQLCVRCHKEAARISHKRGPVKYTAMVRGPVARSMESQAPVDCLGCHEKKVPDHSKLVKLKEHPTAKEVTAECLRCHENEAKEMLETSHWKWQGPSPYSIGHEKRIDLGKHGMTFNNFCININGNWPSCTGCHIGYGWKDQHFNFKDTSNIDCLVCHDRTEWHEYTKTTAGWPKKDVDLKLVAESVGRPQRANCGMQCHFYGGHGGGTKHGSLTPLLDELEEPVRNFDVHMGGKNNFKCQDCHITRNHKIAGRSIPIAVSEGDMSCEYCHTDKPHVGSSLLSHHLNKHTKNIACQTCHIPVFSKGMPTEVLWDWSMMDEHKKGFHHGKRVKIQAGHPTYMWYNGTAKNYVLGDHINENGTTQLAKPMGDFHDPSARIYPFKPHRGKQVFDLVNRYLLPFELWTGVAVHHDWDRAIRAGVKSTDLKYSGKYGFTKTVMYQAVTHEVVPKERALSCRQCHTALAGPGNNCSRCHQKRKDVDFTELVSRGIDFKQLEKEGIPVKKLIGKSDYIDFKALGYKGDPIETGGRFAKLPLIVK